MVFSNEKLILSESGDKYAQIKHHPEVPVWSKNVFMMDLFITNMQFFTLPVVNWWTGAVWITVMFLSAVWFWRHPFSAEDPLVRELCHDTFLQICSDEETNSSTSQMAWGCVHVLEIVNFFSELIF